MRILVVSNLYPPDILGGYEIACAQVSDGLRRRGHQVRVVTSRPRELTPNQSQLHRRFHLVEDWNDQAMGRHQVAYHLHEAESRLVNAYNIHVLLDEINDFEPEVIYLHNILGLGGIGLLATLQYLKLPWVWHLGDCIPLDLCSNQDGLIPELARRFAEEAKGTYIAVSQRLIDENQDAGVLLRDRVELLPYWIQGDQPARPSNPRNFQKGDTLRILSAGRLGVQKGSDLLIRAAAKLLEAKFDNFVLDFYGNASEPGFAELIRSLGVGNHVHLQGPRTQAELLELYEDYDLLAFPTQTREPFGMVPIEAASRGCLPVISESCGVAEWLVHGVHCLKARRTADAFADVFRSVLEGRIAIEPIARRSQAAVWNDFHLRAILPRIEKILIAASGQSRQGAGLADDAYRMARMAEQMSSLLIQEALLNA